MERPMQEKNHEINRYEEKDLEIEQIYEDGEIELWFHQSLLLPIDYLPPQEVRSDFLDEGNEE